MRAPVIAVDGTAGSGKSAASRGVAARLGLQYLDTGAMYRAMTWAILHARIDPDDAAAVAELAPTVSISSGTDPLTPTIHVGGVDVSIPIRADDVTGAVSAVSAVPSVREQLVSIQRDAVAGARAAGTGIVVEGRDITTVVLPDADLKLFITADPAVRAARRSAQVAGPGPADLDRTRALLLERDAKDSGRSVSPLSLAPDAVLMDTSDQTLDEVIEQVCRMVDQIPESR